MVFDIVGHRKYYAFLKSASLLKQAPGHKREAKHIAWVNSQIVCPNVETFGTFWVRIGFRNQILPFIKALIFFCGYIHPLTEGIDFKV